MLHQILVALERANGSLSLAELSQELGIERSALEGMISFWVRKGRLKDSAVAGCGGGKGCTCSSHPDGCAFDSSAPRTIILLLPK